jgi:hypothetical protein
MSAADDRNHAQQETIAECMDLAHQLDAALARLPVCADAASPGSLRELAAQIDDGLHSLEFAVVGLVCSRSLRERAQASPCAMV